MEETSSNCACVAVTLDTDTRRPQRHSDTRRALAGYKQNAGSCRIVTTFNTANREGFARYYSGDRVTFMHGKRVHNPCHHLRVRIDIGRRNIAMRSDNDRDLGRVAASQAFQLAMAHILRFTNNATFFAPKLYTYHRALPDHPHSQDLDFVARNIRAVAHATFGRATVDVMRHAIPCNSLNATV